MKKSSLMVPVLLSGLLVASQAGAECYADYKAKKESPLQLHYGVVQIPDGICSNNAAIKQNISNRISADGWKLLNVLSIFGPEGLSQRQGSAGNYYLKF
ncbi:MAG: hypothetical protein O3A08_00055 [Proteobacteria bacterium]|nr:hypothetical protein [Pseudomonadota bacterium]MDA1284826.1 hypothetical protein [Pseudomonadota bacterium]